MSVLWHEIDMGSLLWFGRQMSSLALLLVVMVNSPWLAMVPPRVAAPLVMMVTVALELVAVTATVVALLTVWDLVLNFSIKFT